MSESIADSVNGTRIPIFSGALAATEGCCEPPGVQAATPITSARSAGRHRARPALLPDRSDRSDRSDPLLRRVDVLVGVGGREVDVRVLLDVLVELLQQAQLELGSALGHLPVGAEHPHAVLERLDVAV